MLSGRTGKYCRDTHAYMYPSGQKPEELCCSRPSSAAILLSSEHFLRAGSELDRHAVHEHESYHPRMQSPSTFSRSLQNMYHAPCYPSTVVGGSTAPPPSAAHSTATSTEKSVADAYAQGTRSASPFATVSGRDGSPVQGEKSKRGERCWSADSNERRARNVKQTLVHRPTSAAHTHVVPTLPAAMRLQPQIVGVQTEQALHAADGVSKVWCAANRCLVPGTELVPDVQ